MAAGQQGTCRGGKEAGLEAGVAGRGRTWGWWGGGFQLEQWARGRVSEGELSSGCENMWAWH